MKNESFVCARPGCEVVTVRRTHNMKYCSNYCCRIETNAKIMENYHEDKAVSKGKKRACRTCGTALSRYNKTKTCAACEKSAKDTVDNELNGLLATVSWN